MRERPSNEGSSEMIDTARCDRCRIYTARTDLVTGPSGRIHCLECGPPPSGIGAEEPTRREDDPWTPRPRTRLEHHARIAAFMMLVVTLSFPLAAWVSQL